MTEQFFGKTFWATLAILAATFVLAAAVFSFPPAPPAALAVAVLVTAAVSWKRPEYGLYIAFAELFANSHGHLISYDVAGFSVSLRMAVFAAVMSAWLLSVVTKRSRLSLSDARLTPFIPLLAAVILGFVVGFSQNEPLKAFKDGNAYFYLGYILPILSVEWDAAKKRTLLQVFAAAAAWAVIVSIGLLYVFTHFPEWMLGPVYKFIRDTRTGELTKMFGNIFRIFLQMQLSAIVMLYLLAPFALLRSLTRRQFWQLTGLFAVILSAVFISLSRSFWVGIVAGDIVLIALTAKFVWPEWTAITRAVGSVALGSVGAILILVVIILFPLPYRVGSIADLTGLFSERATDLSDVAISSRWNLLPPLIDEVKSSPILGSGFGEEVTFKTDDPRARAINPDGTWTTYALEWGWLEAWLKMGILGPIAYLLAFIGIVRGLWPYLYGEQSWIGVSLMSALAMLYATHFFSPYLNHPLGLGLLLFALPFFKPKPPTSGSRVAVLDKIVGPTVQAKTAPLTSE
jgi:hypothetical protein